MDRVYSRTIQRKSNGSLIIVIPVPIAAALQLRQGQHLQYHIINNKIMLYPEGKSLTQKDRAEAEKIGALLKEKGWGRTAAARAGVALKEELLRQEQERAEKAFHETMEEQREEAREEVYTGYDPEKHIAQLRPGESHGFTSMADEDEEPPRKGRNKDGVRADALEKLRIK